MKSGIIARSFLEGTGSTMAGTGRWTAQPDGEDGGGGEREITLSSFMTKSHPVVIR
jgi:hypothetical protein